MKRIYADIQFSFTNKYVEDIKLPASIFEIDGDIWTSIQKCYFFLVIF